MKPTPGFFIVLGIAVVGIIVFGIATNQAGIAIVGSFALLAAVLASMYGVVKRDQRDKHN